MAEYEFAGQVFDYNPIKFGTNIGVKVSVQGVAKSNHEYKVQPTPTLKPGTEEAKFLLAAITAAAPAYNSVTNTWPAEVEFIWNKTEEYTLVPR